MLDNAKKSVDVDLHICLKSLFNTMWELEGGKVVFVVDLYVVERFIWLEVSDIPCCVVDLCSWFTQQLKVGYIFVVDLCERSDSWSDGRSGRPSRLQPQQLPEGLLWRQHPWGEAEKLGAQSDDPECNRSQNRQKYKPCIIW